jgi:hypothetical protein
LCPKWLLTRVIPSVSSFAGWWRMLRACGDGKNEDRFA